MNDVERLQKLIESRYPCIHIVTFEEVLACQLITEATMNEGRNLWLWSVTNGLREGALTNSSPLKNTENPAAAMYYLSKIDDPIVVVALDIVSHLEEPRMMRAMRDVIHKFQRTGGTLFLVDHRETLPSGVKADSIRFDISLPDEDELKEILLRTLREYSREKPIEINIKRSALTTIIRNLRGLTQSQVERIIVDAVSEDNRFDRSDINSILAKKRQMLQSEGLLEYVETPAELTQIGGISRLKRWLKMRQSAMTEEAVKFGLETPRGVLMLGVQGAGKSLCAKAIATAWQWPLLRMDTASLYDRYIGESERRLRMSLRQAEMMSPIILWIDEIEKAFASAASRNTDGGLSQRMFGTLLTWMQEHTAPVFLVATANDIEALPPELLRKGRFDEIFFVDLPLRDTRRQIFDIHIAKRDRDPSQFDLDLLADTSDGFSGAEIEQAVISGLHEAFARSVPLSTELILEVLNTSPPLSVTMAEKVDNLRKWARDRCVPAD